MKNIENARIKLEMQICDIILCMDRPFKVSQLFEEVTKYQITNKELVLEILGQMCESGIMKYSEIEDDYWAYKKVAQYA